MSPVKATTTKIDLRRDHKTAAAFIDETGAIAQDRFFSVGCLVIPEPSVVLRKMQKLRDRRHWYGEIKWVDLTMTSLPLYQELVDVVASEAARYNCFVADRETADPVERFKQDAWLAYEKLATQVLIGAAKPYELLSVMADNLLNAGSRSVRGGRPSGSQWTPQVSCADDHLSPGLKGVRRASTRGRSDRRCHV